MRINVRVRKLKRNASTAGVCRFSEIAQDRAKEVFKQLLSREILPMDDLLGWNAIAQQLKTMSTDEQDQFVRQLCSPIPEATVVEEVKIETNRPAALEASQVGRSRDRDIARYQDTRWRASDNTRAMADFYLQRYDREVYRKYHVEIG